MREYADFDPQVEVGAKGPPDVLNSFSAWSKKECQGVELFAQNRTGNDAGFCQVLDDGAKWTEWKSMLKWAIEKDLSTGGA